MLHYQPVVMLETGKLIGFEALVRWNHPTRGLVSPADFIPIAEETGLIIPIGEWVLREACRQLRQWHTLYPSDPPLTISVNLSGKQLAQPDLIQQVEQILQEVGLAPHHLRLEITESAIIENGEIASQMLARAQALGIQIQMDDFGTGYSSLSYLQQYPINTIKIDRSFISRMGVDGDHTEIVHTIVALAHELAMNVIAEGIETENQLSYLKAAACEYGQGFYVSRPLSPQAVRDLLENETIVCGGETREG